MPTNPQVDLLRRVRLALHDEDFDKAVNALNQLVQMAHDKGDVGAEGRHLGNLALTYYRCGEPERALDYFGKALVCARKEGDSVTEDGLLGNMGNILREVGRYDDAIYYLNQALKIAQTIGDVRGRGIWLANLGLVYDDLGQSSTALELHQQAVAVAHELQDQRGLAARLGNLGNTYASMNQFEQALVHFAEAESLFREMNNQKELAGCLQNLGHTHTELGRLAATRADAHDQYAISLELYSEALDIAQELEDHLSQAQLLRSIGNVLGFVAQFEQAFQYYQAARQYFALLGLQSETTQVQRSMNLIGKQIRQKEQL